MTGDEASESGQGPALRRVRFLLAYRGTAFRGFAANPSVRTVMGDLSEALATIVKSPVELTGAGRTDAGVHAWGQVVTGDLPADADLDGIARRLNKLCGPEIAVREATWAEDGFDARFSATSRSYRYHVWNDPAPNPLLADTAWHVSSALDLAAMSVAAGYVLGEHDFSSFCRAPKMAADRPTPSMIRVLYEANWHRIGESALLRFEIRGSAFCHQMVRSIVGTTVDVGLGRLAAEDLPAIVEARDRGTAGRVAPPEGLVLWHVGYDGQRWDA